MLRRSEHRPSPRRAARGCWIAVVAGLTAPGALGAENVRLTGVPDYEWHGGCFGTATGNLIGYWDRHGLPDCYTGPTAGGVAPLDSYGAHQGIRSLWASEAGLDGRPITQPGHTDDYWVAYESTAEDPYRRAGRPEHAADCLGDFTGLSQAKWADLGGECAGNVDAYSFNFFEREGRRRENFTPRDAGGGAIPDLQSGLRAWSRHRGYEADTFSQLSDFNPDIPPGGGFTFDDLKAEIDAGYPVLLFMQPFGVFSRTLGDRPGLNPPIHGMLAYGYAIDDDGTPYVRYRTSWASGDGQFSPWTAANWTPNGDLNLPLRGVIGYRPRPKLTEIRRSAGRLHLGWHGPLSTRRDEATDTEQPAHTYLVERTANPADGPWEAVAGPIAGLSADVADCCGDAAFFRVRLVSPPP